MYLTIYLILLFDISIIFFLILLSLHSHSFNLYDSAFIFERYLQVSKFRLKFSPNLDWNWINLNMLSHCLVAFIVFDEKLAVILLFVPLYTMASSPLAACNICPCIIVVVAIWWWCAVFLILVLTGDHQASWVLVYSLFKLKKKFWPLHFHIIFSLPILLLSSLLYSWDYSHVYVSS